MNRKLRRAYKHYFKTFFPRDRALWRIGVIRALIAEWALRPDFKPLITHLTQQLTYATKVLARLERTGRKPKEEDE